MPERLGLGLIPGTGWRTNEMQDIARAPEDAGFEGVFCAEVNNDAIATAR
jgi:alkanesulfonate monooxygenase SsuD/methylene tetrahydromethanopterin reductase-like flavin-dependent oxidoreductase (luciferase family)